MDRMNKYRTVKVVDENVGSGMANRKKEKKMLYTNECGKDDDFYKCHLGFNDMLGSIHSAKTERENDLNFTYCMSCCPLFLLAFLVQTLLN